MTKLNEIRIIKGEDRIVPLQFVDESGQCFDIGTPTQIIVSFLKEDGTNLDITLSSAAVVVVSGPRGEITAALTDTDTDLLAECEKGDILAEFTEGSITRKAKFRRVLFVESATL